MLTIFMEYALPFIVILSILVFFHELGHFWVARRCGVRVDVFSIGFGPEIVGWNDRQGTRWRFSIIPLGGYVKFFGDANAASAGSNDAIAKMSPQDFQYTLESKHPKQRIAVALAGPMANYILAIVVLAFLGVYKGIPSMDQPVIGDLKKDFPAFLAGFKKDDKIIKINNEKINNFKDVMKIVPNLKGKEATVVLERKGEEIEKKVSFFKRSEKEEKEAVSVLGVSPKVMYKQLGILDSTTGAITLCWDLSVQSFQGIMKLFDKKESAELGGLLSIGDMASKSVKDGFATSLFFLALLSVSLGFINLLPVPVLDGGHVLLNVMEWVRGKPLSVKTQERIYMAGFALVISLMLYSNFNDLKRYKIINTISSIFG